jgi:hypothetical protein
MKRLSNALRGIALWVAALALTLSPVVSAPVSAWLHADGTLCLECPVAERASTAESRCCPNEPVALNNGDCRDCCEAQRHESPVPQTVRAVALAVPLAAFALEVPAEVSSAIVAPEPPRHGRSVCNSPPSLRAPPAV